MRTARAMTGRISWGGVHTTHAPLCHACPPFTMHVPLHHTCPPFATHAPPFAMHPPLPCTPSLSPCMPPGMHTPQEQPCMPPPEQPHTHPPGSNHARPLLWTEWQTGVKILPCPKLRLRAVNMKESVFGPVADWPWTDGTRTIKKYIWKSSCALPQHAALQ